MTGMFVVRAQARAGLVKTWGFKEKIGF